MQPHAAALLESHRRRVAHSNACPAFSTATIPQGFLSCFFLCAQGFRKIAGEQGFKGLFRGWVPTAFGYSAQGAFKVRRRQLRQGLGRSLAVAAGLGGHWLWPVSSWTDCMRGQLLGHAPPWGGGSQLSCPPCMCHPSAALPAQLPAACSFLWLPCPPRAQFGLYEYFKKTYSDMAGPEAAKKYQVRSLGLAAAARSSCPGVPGKEPVGRCLLHTRDLPGSVVQLASTAQHASPTELAQLTLPPCRT